LVHRVTLDKEQQAKRKAEQEAANDANIRSQAVQQAVNA
jgi:hypothetical protein